MAAMLSAPILTLLVAPTTTVAAHRDAIASTITGVPPFAPIIWWKQVNFATVIVPQLAQTAITAPWTAQPELLPHAIFSALTPLCCPALMTIIAVQAAVIQYQTPIANRSVETTFLN